uniref:SHSP domain-containing protein n=1 Tax=Chlamydomonas euryale TaxID=1486919 RepID=A0A7R9YZ95_9CHLO|mmetsp:Transcript_35268/g.104319  ORF Transcript_35268/g.104319 Transcript_35268/m.104319 type:complete len:158 (+) Transcript_35268:68-541(+)
MALSLFTDLYEPRMGRMERVLDHVLSNALSGDRDLSLAPIPSHSGHAFDVVESKDAFELLADAPGFSPEDIHVKLDNNVLTVSGKHEVRKEAKDGDKVWRTERQMRSFSRAFTLPENTKPEDISANLDKGVLTVRVPKVPAVPKPEPKRIQVQASAA